jgi:hypothetical protein
MRSATKPRAERGVDLDEVVFVWVDATTRARLLTLISRTFGAPSTELEADEDLLCLVCKRAVRLSLQT